MDEDIERAIEASLADQAVLQSKELVVIDSPSDDDEDDLDAPVRIRPLAPKRSLDASVKMPKEKRLKTQSASSSVQNQQKEGNERLKRKAAGEELDTAAVKRPPLDSKTVNESGGHPANPFTDRAQSPSTLSDTSNLKMAYPHGGLRITRTPGRKNVKNCVNLTDLIHRDHLVSACAFSFFIADEEFFPHFPLSHSSDPTVPIYIGRDPKMDPVVTEYCSRNGIAIKDKLGAKQWQIIEPKIPALNQRINGSNFHSFYAMSGGSSHSKVLALVYPNFLRIVITSCNMMDIDTLRGDNHWYIHDLPRLSSRANTELTSFETDFLEHLIALQTPNAFVDSIRGHYDYSKIKVHLVTSVPNTHSGVNAEKHGLLRLRRIIQDLNLKIPAKENEGGDLRLEVCCASIGKLTSKWLTIFNDCALGMDAIEVPSGNCPVPDLKLFYPTTGDKAECNELAQLAASNIGCHTRPWNEAPDAIKRTFHHYQSKDTGWLFHQKLILTYNARDTKAPPYYVYVGSANLSASAWGTIENDKTKKANEATCKTKIKFSNFECGVVVPGHLLDDLLEPGTRTWQDGIVPYVQTAKRYDLRIDKPWNDPRWVKDYQEDWHGN